MALGEEINKLISEWKQRSSVSKIIFCTSVLITILSLSSLGDQVYAFKGFLSKGIEFYHWATSWIQPLINSSLGINISRSWLDVCILLTLAISMTRKSELAMKTKYERRTPPVAVIGFIGSIISSFVLGVGLMKLTNDFIGLAITFALYPTVLGLSIIKDKREPFYIASGLVLLCYLLVAILAAISEGLART